MDAATSELLIGGARDLGVPLAAGEVARFATYLELLTRWNARINLTRVIRPDEVVAKHFLDSLAVVPYIEDARTLVDVGAGAGFPGAVLAIARPDLAVTLVESVVKKTAFLEALRRELGLSLTVRPVRVEQLGEQRFDAAVSRATFAPPEWVERGAKLVAPGGVLVAMLGRERPPLPTPSGFSGPALYSYGLPLEGERALAILRRRGANG